MSSKGQAPQKHEWIMLATFTVDETTVAEMAKARLTVLPSIDSPPASVQFDLVQEDLVTLDGPGCAKCSVEWTAGWGMPCPGEVPTPWMGTRQ